MFFDSCATCTYESGSSSGNGLPLPGRPAKTPLRTAACSTRSAMVIGVTSSNVLRRRSAPRSAGVVLLRSIVAFATCADPRALVATTKDKMKTVQSASLYVIMQMILHIYPPIVYQGTACQPINPRCTLTPLALVLAPRPP